MDSIKQRWNTIDKNIKKYYKKLKELQEECPHTNVDKKYKGNTGNYDPSCDIYWIEFKCPDCGKFWTVEQ